MYLFRTDGYQFGDTTKFALQMVFGFAFIICFFYASRSWLTGEVMLGLSIILTTLLLAKATGASLPVPSVHYFPLFNKCSSSMSVIGRMVLEIFS